MSGVSDVAEVSPGHATTKRCAKCKEFKPRTSFGRYSRSMDGLRWECNDCRRAERQTPEAKKRKRQSYWRNREADLAGSKRWREANRERKAASDRSYYEVNRERIKAQAREYRAANPEAKRERDRLYYEANRERQIAQSKAWRQKNRNRAKLLGRRAAARRAALKRDQQGEPYSADDLMQMVNDQCGVCAYCEAPLKGGWHAEHMIPLSRGGLDCYWNIAISCPPCNQSKFTKTAEEFMEALTR